MKTTNDLLKVEPHFLDILNSFPFYAFLVDSQHRILAANEAVRRDLGIDPERLIGAYCPRILHGCGSPITNCPLSKALETGYAAEQEILDAKSEKWLNAAVYPIQVPREDLDPIYLHFARDITEFKHTAHELSESLEHQWAMSNLLQKLQYCRDSDEIMRVLIDQILCLTWTGMSVKAIGFLVQEHELQMVVQRNLDPSILKRCERLRIGECCCGRAAQTGRMLVCFDSSVIHTKCEEMIGHQHVVLPIRHEGVTLGVYILYLYNLDKLDKLRLRFLESAADAAAVALATGMARDKAKEVQKMYIAQLISAQEEERKSVAHELQERVCQSLSALLLETQVRSSEDKAINHIRQQYETQIRELIDEVRLIAGKLRPTVLDDYGFEPALSRVVKQLKEHTPLEIDYQFITSPDWRGRRLPAEIETGFYRVAIDALNNILSHSSASRVCIIVILQSSKLMMLIEDNGCGFDYPSVRKHRTGNMGILAMEERIMALGGALSIESSPQNGTTVRAEIVLTA